MSLLDGVLPLARDGDAHAQWEAGDLWLHVGESSELGLYWYRQAARQGHEKAAYSLAVLHFNSRGLYLDPEEALFWCSVARVGGNKSAAPLWDAIRASVAQRVADRVAARLSREHW